MKRTVVFVYGTLLRGESNHGYLSAAVYRGEDSLRSTVLFDCGPYPILRPGKGVVHGAP